jgi:hypothetical protein
MNWRRSLAALFPAFLVTASFTQSASQTAIDKLLQTAKPLTIVALGERHGSKSEHAFLTELLRDPRFPDTFRVVVVEFGNALYQDVADRYTSGENISPQELVQIWQNTTVPKAWDSPVYAAFFKTVREVNQQLPKAKRIRIVLGDPPVDWSKLNNVDEFRPDMDRDKFYAMVMERDCGDRCLLICGTNHFYWKDPLADLRPPSAHKNALQYYLMNKGDREKLISVLPLFSKEPGFSELHPPKLIDVRNSWLKTMRFGEVERSKVSILKKVNDAMVPVEVQPETTLAVSEVVDWVLYLGKSDEIVPAPAELYQNKAYIKELYRRAKIVSDAFGFDLTSDIREVDPNASR